MILTLIISIVAGFKLHFANLDNIWTNCVAMHYCPVVIATFSVFLFLFSFNFTAVLFLAIFFAAVISQLTSGLWIVYVGFIPSAWFILACYVLSGIWALFCVREIPRQINIDTTVRFFSLENVKCFLKLFRKRRDAGRRNLLVLMLCGGLVFLTTVGIDGVKSLYILKSPLCWSPTLVGYYYAFEAFVHGVGSVIGIPLLGRCFKELNVARVGMVTIVLASVILAFSDRTWMVFACK